VLRAVHTYTVRVCVAALGCTMRETVVASDTCCDTQCVSIVAFTHTHTMLRVAMLKTLRVFITCSALVLASYSQSVTSNLQINMHVVSGILFSFFDLHLSIR